MRSVLVLGAVTTYLVWQVLHGHAAAESHDTEQPTAARALSEAPSVVAGYIVDEPQTARTTRRVRDEAGMQSVETEQRTVARFQVQELISGATVPPEVELAWIQVWESEQPPPPRVPGRHARVVLGIQPHRVGAGVYVPVHQIALDAGRDEQLEALRGYTHMLRARGGDDFEIGPQGQEVPFAPPPVDVAGAAVSAEPTAPNAQELAYPGATSVRATGLKAGAQAAEGQHPREPQGLRALEHSAPRRDDSSTRHPSPTHGVAWFLIASACAAFLVGFLALRLRYRKHRRGGTYAS